jgi:hypothetical protein
MTTVMRMLQPQLAKMMRMPKVMHTLQRLTT